MPEGPSIVILKEAVQQFKGQKIINASGDNKNPYASILNGQTITDFKSWGKHFLICFPKITLRIHLMMFGSYKINEHSTKAPRLHLQFENGELNFYTCSLQLMEQAPDDVYDWSADVMNPKWDAKTAMVLYE